jgi:hypothetical protein
MIAHAFMRSAGARLTAMRHWGKTKPEFLTAARTVARLDGGVGESHDVEGWQPWPDVHLDERAGQRLCRHASPPRTAVDGVG